MTEAIIQYADTLIDATGETVNPSVVIDTGYFALIWGPDTLWRNGPHNTVEDADQVLYGKLRDMGWRGEKLNRM